MKGWSHHPGFNSVTKQTLTLNGVELFVKQGDRYYVPRGFEDFKYASADDGMFGFSMRDDIDQISLRDYQVPAVDAVIKSLRNPPKGAILFAPCGRGKTVMGLEIARRLGRKTCVLVHKEFLVDQWIERAKTFLPKAKVGVWQRDRVPNGSEDIVIAMVQSITKRDYPDEMFLQFGTVIADETHRYAAPLWQNAFGKFTSAYRVGLTATPERKDGMQKALFLHIGPIVYEMEGHKRVPTIWRINTDVSMKLPKLWNGDINTSKMITQLSQVTSRTEMIVRMSKRALNRGRKVLILSERVAHVQEIKSMLSKELEDTDFTVDKYIGGMKQAQRDESAKADIIIGTYAMAQEGLDIPELDTLILATPKTSITQSVGRILRDAPDKKDPVVLDIVDRRLTIMNAYWGARRKKYLELGYYLTGE